MTAGAQRYTLIVIGVLILWVLTGCPSNTSDLKRFYFRQKGSIQQRKTEREAEATQSSNHSASASTPDTAKRSLA